MIFLFSAKLQVMSGLLETGSSPSEVDSLDFDEVSFSKCCAAFENSKLMLPL